MKKTSMTSLPVQNKLDQAIDELQPDGLSAEKCRKLRELLNKQADVLPAWLFVEAVEQVPVAISITDRYANILYVNHEFTQVTGYKPADILGENESLLSDKTTPQRLYQKLWHQITNKKIWHGRLVNRHKSGSRYLADLIIAPILDDQGEISHFLGMHRDITKSYELEEKVKNQKMLIESVLNSSPIAMVLLDSNDKVILDNQMYKALVSDLRVGEPAEFFLQSLRREMAEKWTLMRETHTSFANREIRVDLGGSRAPRWFSCSGNWFYENDISAGAFFKGGQQEYLLLTLNDTSHQRKQQEELHIQTLRALLAEEEQIQSLRETLLGVMHQIQQPVNQIQAALQLLQNKGEAQNGPVVNLLNEIRRSGQETLATLQKCLPGSKQTAIVPVNINKVLHEVIMLCTDKFLASGIVVDWQPTPVLPSLMGSEMRLRTLFKQLFDNAVAAMRRSAATDRILKITTHLENHLISVAIEDTGPGIPPHLRQKVFEPFYTTSGAAGFQAGVGLVMVKEIVNQHHGIIEIDPDYRQGCRFNIGFPLNRTA
ncbi:MAG: nitrogen fixation negative regulator NifL [Gammaproteobacteria bacterium]